MPAKNECLHRGHRQRLRTRCLTNGIEVFEDHVALEFLLTYSIPQKDTNELAHRLINRFGSLLDVFNADYQDLCEVEGMGPVAASFVTLIPQIARLYCISLHKKTRTINCIEEAINFISPNFIGRKNEMVYLLCLGSNGKIMKAEFISEGIINASPLYVRPVVENALNCQATTVILAHNHPHGIATPSSDDLSATSTLAHSLDSVGLRLADHLIITPDGCLSMRTAGFFDQIKGTIFNG